MAKVQEATARRGAGVSVVLYPVIGLLAVGNAVFALLWLLNPIASGPAGGPSGRRIEVRTQKRLLRVGDGLNAEGPNAGFETRVSGEEFEQKLKLLVHLTRMTRTGEQAAEFFGSDAGREAKPAVVFDFPSRGSGGEALEVYAIDMRRQAVYCRLKSTGEELAVKLDQYEKIAGEFARLGGGVAGGLSVPYYMAVDEALRSRLAKLQGPLAITSVSSDPRQQLLQTLSNPLAGYSGLQFQQPDRSTLLLALRLPDDQAMARGLADAMARASEQVKVQHLDFATQGEAVRQFARAVARPASEIEDSLVLQYAGRVRLLRGPELLGREEAGPMALGVQTRFEGEKVVAQALDDLLSERGLLYFAEGCGERRMADRRNEGLSQTADYLGSRGFRAAALDVTSAKAVPSDCQVLVLAGPRKPLPAEAEKAIAAYVERGGRLAVLLDPPEGIVPLADTLKRFGISAPDPKKVLEVPGRLNPPVAIELELNPKLDFVAKWTREAAVFYTATELAVAAPAEDAAFEVLRVGQPAEGGANAPCLLAAVRPKAGGRGPRLLVFGDVDAFSNQLVRQLATNAQLLSDALGWLTETK
ncbi:MAG TPA: DUF4350 domain-containing protein [Planctomycetota bacterium]|nr:DUF4350 domain-containing protein [Planctomycetota bacterium]